MTIREARIRVPSRREQGPAPDALRMVRRGRGRRTTRPDPRQVCGMWGAGYTSRVPMWQKEKGPALTPTVSWASCPGGVLGDSGLPPGGGGRGEGRCWRGPGGRLIVLEPRTHKRVGSARVCTRTWACEHVRARVHVCALCGVAPQTCSLTLGLVFLNEN